MKKNKLMNTLLSVVMSFLIILIVALFSRSMVSNIFPENSKVSIFINDYLNMMVKKIDMVALKLNVKRNTVTQYQVDLITQSIEDYINYSMYQSSDAIKNFDLSKQANNETLEKYKNEYYKMTLENPYLRSLTVFGMNGNMLLNLYLSGNRSWPYEIEGNLVNAVSKDGYVVLNASNENSFYVFQHIKNKSGDIIVATRNDYVFVSDIAHYYQVADKTFYVSDFRNDVYAVVDGNSPRSIENASSIISKFAFYKKQPSFTVGKNNALSVALIGLEYPNYFEFIVLVITAFSIVILKCFIQAILNFFKYLFFGRKERLALPKDDVPMIDNEILEGKKPSKEYSKSAGIDITSLKDEMLLKDSDENILVNEPLFQLDDDIDDSISVKNIINLELDTKETIKKEKPLVVAVKEENSQVENISYKTLETLDRKSIKLDITEPIEKISVVNVDTKTDDSPVIVKDIDELDVEDVKEKEYVQVKAKPKTNEELFSAFDDMLASIISKVENETRNSITKRN